MKFGVPLTSASAGSVVTISGVVPVSGPITSQTVASGATANTVNTAANSSLTPLTTTVIAGGAQTIELHGLVLTVTGTSANAGSNGRLIRSDTGADLVAPVKANSTTITVVKDYQGAQLPPGVSLQSITTTVAAGATCTVSIDINYNLIG